MDQSIRSNSCIERRVRRRKTMSVQRKRYSAELKTRVALEAIKGQKTANEIAAEYVVDLSCISASLGTPHLYTTFEMASLLAQLPVFPVRYNSPKSLLPQPHLP